MNVLNATRSKDRVAFDGAMCDLSSLISTITNELVTMWARSDPADYNNFRTFLMGIRNQPMFPNGVIYEGVSNEPRFYRGSSGANDSMIPTIDNLLQITETLPANALTEMLKDFRSYRPTSHSHWLDYVYAEARKLNVSGFALQDSNSAGKTFYHCFETQVDEFLFPTRIKPNSSISVFT
jgi:indoleamine 2,3-dioxygenase